MSKKPTTNKLYLKDVYKMKKLIAILMVLAMFALVEISPEGGAGICGAAEGTMYLSPLRSMTAAEDWPNCIKSATLTVENDTTNFMSGSQAVKLTTAGAGQLIVRSVAASPTNVYNGVGVWFYVTTADLANLGYLKIIISEDGTATKGYVGYVWRSTDKKIKPDQWNYIFLQKGGFSVTGTPTAWTTTYPVLTVQYAIGRAADTNTSVTIGKSVTDVASKGGVILCFDDCRYGVYEYAYPILKARGYKACLGVISSLVGTGEYMTLAELQEVSNVGWAETNIHTATHPTMATCTKAQAISEIETCHDYLIANGLYLGSDVLVWPGNTAVPTVATDWYGSDLAEPYVKMVRGISYTYGETTTVQAPSSKASSWMRSRWDQLPYYGIYSTNANETWAGTYEATVSNITDNGGVVILYMHGVITTAGQAGGVDITLTLLNEMVNWLAQEEMAGRLKVTTFNEWYAMANKTGGADTYLNDFPIMPYTPSRRLRGEGTLYKER